MLVNARERGSISDKQSGQYDSVHKERKCLGDVTERNNGKCDREGNCLSSGQLDTAERRK